MAISADPNDNLRLHELDQRAGTSIADFASFIQRVLNLLGPGTPARRRALLMDNLSSDHSAVITQLVHTAGHRIVFRAPYYPMDGPIEYVFNTIEQRISDFQYAVEIRNNQDLVAAVQTIVSIDPVTVVVGDVLFCISNDILDLTL